MSARTPDPRRSYWLKTLHQWHWISSAVCLVGMLLFAITGITLNHATQIESQPQVVTRDGDLPPELKAALAPKADAGAAKSNAELPPDLRRWLMDKLSLDVGERQAEWTREEIYLALPRPGGDAWLRIDRAAGSVEYELTDRGWISYLNDLHKGRNSGRAWSWFIDIFAVACLVFCITGLFILKMHAAQRVSTWPIVALGLLVPLLVAVLLIH
ncbi:PepSY-associated TM helix domain-containing protein [soil metagenome]